MKKKTIRRYNSHIHQIHIKWLFIFIQNYEMQYIQNYKISIASKDYISKFIHSNTIYTHHQHLK